jgi:hypothetical protein
LHKCYQNALKNGLFTTFGASAQAALLEHIPAAVTNRATRLGHNRRQEED